MIRSEEARWFAADGTPLPSADGAASVEIIEFLDGEEVQRTYADVGEGVPAPAGIAPPDFVLLPENEDQAKTSWDLWVSENGVLEFVDDRAKLFRHLGLEHTTDLAVMMRTLCAFLELPVWDAAPPKLQGEVYGWLRTVSGDAQTKSLDGGLETKRRSELRESAEQRIVRWEQAMEDLLARLFDRQREVVLARLTGTKVRKGTRHWKSAQPPTETKAIDVDTVLQPERWAMEVAVDAEELLTRIFRTTAAEVAGDDEPPAGVLDSSYVRRAVAEKVRRIMSSTEARAQQVADVILNLDAAGSDLDEIVEAVKGTYDQRRIWAETTARTETTGAVNGASLFTAIELGLTTKTWLSSRDDKVRHTHTRLGGGDGQTAALAVPFVIGGFPLLYPGDPAGPAHEVINCRCSLIFDSPAKEDREGDAPAFDPEAFERLLQGESGQGELDLEELGRHARAGFNFLLVYAGIHPAQLTFLAALDEALGAPDLSALASGVDWVLPFDRLVSAVQRHASYVAIGALIAAVAARTEVEQLAEELGVPPEQVAELLAALEAAEQSPPNAAASRP